MHADKMNHCPSAVQSRKCPKADKNNCTPMSIYNNYHLTYIIKQPKRQSECVKNLV